MIEKRDKKLYLKCDYCKKESFWKEITVFDLLKKSDIPNDWTAYKEFGVTKMTICSDKKCQKELDKLLHKDDNNKKIAQDNWTGTV